MSGTPLTLEWLVGAVMSLLAVGLGFFYWVAGRLDASGRSQQDVERALASYREYAATTFVRSDGLHALRAELTGAITALRTEVRADAERSVERSERAEAEIKRQLAEIKDSMLRLAGDRRTRSTDVP